MQSHTRAINAIATAIGAKSYLEIGTRTPADNYDLIAVPDKVGVDPAGGRGILQLTSDEYFAACTRSFDLVFVDGDHREEQVYRDGINALRHLNPGGVVAFHDVNPLTAEAALPEKPDNGRPWNGTAWRAYQRLKWRVPMSAAVDIPNGMGLLWGAFDGMESPAMAATWHDFDRYRVKWLALMPLSAVVSLLEAKR